MRLLLYLLNCLYLNTKVVSLLPFTFPRTVGERVSGCVMFSCLPGFLIFPLKALHCIVAGHACSRQSESNARAEWFQHQAEEQNLGFYSLHYWISNTKILRRAELEPHVAFSWLSIPSVRLLLASVTLYDYSESWLCFGEDQPFLSFIPMCFAHLCCCILPAKVEIPFKHWIHISQTWVKCSGGWETANERCQQLMGIASPLHECWVTSSPPMHIHPSRILLRKVWVIDKNPSSGTPKVIELLALWRFTVWI